jgi:hypothetical protein
MANEKETTTPSPTDDASFNDNELSDIMNEIESLEKEFVSTGSAVPEDLKNSAIKENDLQDMIDQDINNFMAGGEETGPIETSAENTTLDPFSGPDTDIAGPEAEATPVSGEEEVNNVVSLENFKNSGLEKSALPVGQEMNFTLHGEFSLKLNFTMGEETFGLTVAPDTGFMLEMKSGLKINLPLVSAKSAKLRKVG